MGEHVVIDARNLEPPEPLVRVMEAIDALGAGDTLQVLIDQEPRLLYPILDRSGFAHRTGPGTESVFEVTIWPAAT